jgi:hypothetical protein
MCVDGIGSFRRRLGVCRCGQQEKAYDRGFHPVECIAETLAGEVKGSSLVGTDRSR